MLATVSPHFMMAVWVAHIGAFVASVAAGFVVAKWIENWLR